MCIVTVTDKMIHSHLDSQKESVNLQVENLCSLEKAKPWPPASYPSLAFLEVDRAPLPCNTIATGKLTTNIQSARIVFYLLDELMVIFWCLSGNWCEIRIEQRFDFYCASENFVRSDAHVHETQSEVSELSRVLRLDENWRKLLLCHN